MNLERAVRLLMKALKEQTFSPDLECKGPICRAMVAVEEELKKHRAAPRARAK